MSAPPPDPRADLDLALSAARSAGELVMRFFGSGSEVTYKSPNQPVTEADLAADRTLREILSADRPDYGWLSEETADSPDRLARDRVWVVDPIDGTRSFVDGVPEFAISIGLAEGDRALVGVVYNPASGDLYHAVLGGGAFRNGERVVAAAGVRGQQGVLLASRSEIRRGDLAPLEDEWEVRPWGSTACKMVRVAAGEAQAFVSRGPKAEWDVCAAALIVAEAGGEATDMFGEPFRYNQADPLRRGVVAASPAAHARLVDRVRSLGVPPL